MTCNVLGFKLQNLLLQASKVGLFKMSFYAVASGRNPGIFQTWGECENQVKGFKGAKFKKFNTMDEAKRFLSGGTQAYQASKPKPPSPVQRPPPPVQKPPTRKSQRQIPKPPSTSKVQTTPDVGFSEQSSEFNFETMDDIHDELMRKMDEIENSVGTIKKNVTKMSKAIMIDPIPSNKSSSLKRHGDFIDHLKSKRLKTVTINQGNRSYNFTMDESGYVEVFTDGACSNNGYSAAKAGLGVYFGNEHPLNVSEPVSGRPTNNCGEIQATTKAIRLAHSVGIKKLVIKTDSQFVINSVTKWMTGWKRKGWKLASGEPVKNEVDFKELDKVLNLLEIKWEYVNAHKGIHGNEMADQLAKEGATKYSSVKR